MNQLDEIVKQLRALPYADMVKLAVRINADLEEKCGQLPLTHGHIADVMASLPVGEVKPSAQTSAEEAIIRKLFNRKRTITVSQLGTGYTMEVLTLPGSVVHGPDLRVMFQQMLDQLVTLSVLKE